MSFSSKAKHELLLAAEKNSAACCRHAQSYGLLLFARCFSLLPRSYSTENAEVARITAESAAGQAGVFVTTQAKLTRKEKSAYTLTVEGEDQRKKMLECFGYTGREPTLRMNWANLENSCCACAFLRGAFLCCGYVTDPQKEYHLEFAVPYQKLATDLMSLISQQEEILAQPAYINRKGVHVVYFKESEKIEDFLTFIGAPNAAMAYMQAKMIKDVRNNVNRITNFETANMDKTASACAKQLAALQKIEQKMGLDSLPEDLRGLAALRMENPDMTLRTLAQELGLSRSGVNHRLMRILELAQEL